MRNEIKIIQHENPVNVDNIGGILYPFKDWDSTATGNRWYSKPPKEYYTNKLFIPLNCASPNPWQELKNFKVVCEKFKEMVKYKCPYTGYNHYWFVPALIFTQDIKFWLDRNSSLLTYQRELILDTEWMKDFNILNEKKSFELHSVGKILAGAGYTYGTSVSDGDGRLYDALVALDNGDCIGGKVWVWYNK